MLQSDNFTMRISPRDKLMLADVAKHFQRSQADTLKTLVRETYHLIKEKSEDPKPASQEQAVTA